MILPFSTQFKDGTRTYFIHKIWQSLISTEIIPNANEEYRFHYLNDFQKRFGASWDQTIVFNPKPHTIREDAHDRWHEGRLIHPVVFNRSKNQFQFAPTVPCVSTQKIEIRHYLHETWLEDTMIIAKYHDKNCECSMERYYNVIIDGKMLKTDEVKKLSENDGFKSIDDFFIWFNPENREFMRYTGKIIHWTDLKY